MMDDFLDGVLKGDLKSISRTLSFVENRRPGYLELLDKLYKTGKKAKVIGITGAPGVGKSSLTDLYVESLSKDKKVAVIAIDPSSPFSGGALLGDRIRMSEGRSNVYFRSVATRGSVGGISDSVFNMIVVLRAAGYDYIIIETVGVGQNEVSIARLSDIVMLVLNPGSGDDIQMMKAGIMEIGDLFVINKSDLEGVDELYCFLHSSFSDSKIVKTSVKKREGIDKLTDAVNKIYDEEIEKIKNRTKDVLKEGLKYLMIKELNKKVESLVDEKNVDIEEIVKAAKSPYSEMKKLLKGEL
jgi:LAO/AO transport system kinase